MEWFISLMCITAILFLVYVFVTVLSTEGWKTFGQNRFNKLSLSGLILFIKDHSYERTIKFITILPKENTVLKGL